MKVVTIVGARPQFIKAAALSRALRGKHQEILVHTGQHYDYAMSGAFFDCLQIPPPHVNLGVGSGLHGAQTGAMLTQLEEVLQRERPDWVVVYGDTNSTLAATLAAAKLHLRIAHVEAGLRSFNRWMPEEINRVVADHLSNFHFCPSDTAVANLEAEGVRDNVHMVGDIMLDVLNWAKERGDGEQTFSRVGLERGKYLLATVHRSENTDDSDRLCRIVDALNALEEPVLFPVHPRAQKMIALSGRTLSPNLRLVPPLNYLEMVTLTGSARLVLTDSGGLQKEAYWLGIPCVTLRDETEWVETVSAGWNCLVGAITQNIIYAVHHFAPPAAHPPLYGDGCVAERCVGLMT
jgi:UDP-GlcNAc3NAcA epimerase